MTSFHPRSSHVSSKAAKQRAQRQHTCILYFSQGTHTITLCIVLCPCLITPHLFMKVMCLIAISLFRVQSVMPIPANCLPIMLSFFYLPISHLKKHYSVVSQRTHLSPSSYFPHRSVTRQDIPTEFSPVHRKIHLCRKLVPFPMPACTPVKLHSKTSRV